MVYQKKYPEESLTTDVRILPTPIDRRPEQT